MQIFVRLPGARFVVLVAVLFILLSWTTYAQQKQLPPLPEKLFQWDTKEPYADSFISDGVPIGIIRNAGVTIAVSGYDGKDYLFCEITVLNETDKRVNVFPRDFYLTFKDKNGKFGYVYPLPPEKIAKKYLSRAKWGNFFRTFAAGMATTTTQSVGSGTAYVYGSSGSATGVYSGTATTTSPNLAAQRNAAVANDRAVEAANAKGQSVILNSLKANTVFPKTYVSGLVHFERKKFSVGILYIIIDGTAYSFPFGAIK